MLLSPWPASEGRWAAKAAAERAQSIIVKDDTPVTLRGGKKRRKSRLKYTIVGESG